MHRALRNLAKRIRRWRPPRADQEGLRRVEELAFQPAAAPVITLVEPEPLEARVPLPVPPAAAVGGAQYDDALASFVVPLLLGLLLPPVFTRIVRLFRFLAHTAWLLISSATRRWRAKEAALAAAVTQLQAQLTVSEAQIATSARQIASARALLEARAGLLASLLIPTESLGTNDDDEPMRQRKLAELASLLLDLLNWKVGQGTPLPRGQFWAAYSVCEAMLRDLAPTEAGGRSCAAQLSRLILEFEVCGRSSRDRRATGLWGRASALS